MVKRQLPLLQSSQGLLESRNIEFEERNINTFGWSKEQLLEAVPNARSVPQIFLDDELVGGFTELRTKLTESK